MPFRKYNRSFFFKIQRRGRIKQLLQQMAVYIQRDYKKYDDTNEIENNSYNTDGSLYHKVQI
jgi:hypothetical protein